MLHMPGFDLMPDVCSFHPFSTSYKQKKTASMIRKKELDNLARHVNVDQAAAVIDLGDKKTKKGGLCFFLVFLFFLCEELS
jgi:hypothetical protein